jgi:hypothetical protein
MIKNARKFNGGNSSQRRVILLMFSRNSQRGTEQSKSYGTAVGSETGPTLHDPSTPRNASQSPDVPVTQ